MLVEDIRNLWQVGAICEFVVLFGEALKIAELDVETLEQQLAQETEDGPYLRDVRLSLIKSLSSNRTINLDNMDDFIRRQYTYRRIYPNPLLKVERVWKELFDNHEQEVPDDESDLGEVEEVEQQTLIAWLDLPIPQRVGILHDLCEWQLHSDKFRERVGGNTELQATQWRISPVGVDADRQVYYLLSNGRLYSCQDPAAQYEKNNKKRKRGGSEQVTRKTYQDDWTCVASTYEQWQEFTKDLSKTRNADEKQLLKYLRLTALPYVEEIEEQKRAEAARKQARDERIEAERIKEMLRQELLSTRKRSSRIQMIDERKEAERERAEQLRREQELEEKARALAVKEAAGIAPVQPKTREARLRDRELREAMAQMQQQQNGTEGSHDGQVLDVSSVNGGILEQVHDNGSTYAKVAQPHENGQTGIHDQTSQNIGHVAHAQAVMEPANVSSGHLLPDEKLESTTYTQPPNGHSKQDEPMQISQNDVNWVNRKADEMSRGSTVAHEHVSATNGHQENKASQPEKENANHVDTQSADTLKMLPDGQSIDLSKQPLSDALQPSEADMSWVQKQADRMSGPQTVSQESITDTLRRVNEPSTSAAQP